MAVIGRFRNVIKKRFLGIIKKRFNQKMMMVRNMKNWQSPRVRGPVEVLFSQEYLSLRVNNSVLSSNITVSNDNRENLPSSCAL